MRSWWNWWGSDDDQNADVEARPCRDAPCRHQVQLHFKPPTASEYAWSLIVATAGYWAIFLALYCLSLATVLSEQGQIDVYCFLYDGSPEGAVTFTFWTSITFGIYPLILYLWAILSNNEICYRRWAYCRLMEYGIILDFKNREGWMLTLTKSKIFSFAALMSLGLASLVTISNPKVLLIVIPLLFKLFEQLRTDRSFESQELITVAKFVEPGDGEDRRSEDNIERACKILTKSEFMDEDDLKWHAIGCRITSTKFDWATVGQLGFTEDWVKEHPKFRRFPMPPYSYWGSRIYSTEEKDLKFVRTMWWVKFFCILTVFALEGLGVVQAKDWAQKEGLETERLVGLSASVLSRVDCDSRRITAISPPPSPFPPPPPPSPYPPPPPPMEIAFAISTGEVCGAFLDGMEYLCDGNGQAPARWIVNSVAPSTSASNDLEGDGECAYWARINSDDSSSPPLGMATWRLLCDGAWTDIDLTLTPPTVD